MQFKLIPFIYAVVVFMDDFFHNIIIQNETVYTVPIL